MLSAPKVGLIVTAILLLAVTGTFAQDGSPSGKCSFSAINILAPAGTNPGVFDMNDVGAMVGTIFRPADQSVSSFLFFRGKLSRFRFPGSSNTFARNINNKAVIVGSFDSPKFSGSRAFMVRSGGFRQIQIPGFPDAVATAEGINDLGDIVGSFNGDGTDRGYLLQNGKLTILAFPGAGGPTQPLSINNGRTIVGVYATDETLETQKGFIWKSGVFSDFPTLRGLTLIPAKINDSGDIVGAFLDENGIEHGFVLDKGQIRVIDAPGGQTTVFDVNNKDQVLAVSFAPGTVTSLLGACSSLF